MDVANHSFLRRLKYHLQSTQYEFSVLLTRGRPVYPLALGLSWPYDLLEAAEGSRCTA